MLRASLISLVALGVVAQEPAKTAAPALAPTAVAAPAPAPTAAKPLSRLEKLRLENKQKTQGAGAK